MNQPFKQAGVVQDARIEAIDMVPIGSFLAENGGYGSAREIGHARMATLVFVRLASGIVGIGECYGPPKTTLAYLDILRDNYLGQSAFDHRAIWRRMTNVLYHVRAQSQLAAAISGLDIALHDGLGKLLGLPVYRLLGGEEQASIQVYASGGYFHEPKALSLEAQLERVAGEFDGYKIKIGRGIESDIERMQSARRILGDDVAIMADINGAYTADIALESMTALAPYRPYWIEEPVAPEDLPGFRRLAARRSLRIAAGEASVNAVEFRELAATGSVDVLMPDLNLCGGFVEALRIADLAHLGGLRVSPHVWGSAVGIMAAAHFAAALPSQPHPDRRHTPTWVEFDVSASNPLREALLTEPLALSKGQLALPTAPGLGIEIDDERLAALKIEI
ncbi:mandelate racemase/muconate lactonizing enzyme family protein [Vreelandella malpeensis]|uniref:Mandelate racemase/muconate lactonizing enzyme family protein n=1 Tax=Vreelandella malpeensis TaxID=1172368 RepID=A0ABS8DNP3_9GAMM|nr:mandelate racemase/muconate lactonizing enzyme family protein [Halomonas malpeensis]MCB8887904.1 mandelate racemase/muconate lactonizing enzyme family protein [Halomonas malpeensis]